MIKIKSVGGQFLAKWIWTQWTNPVSALLLPCHKIIGENNISEVKFPTLYLLSGLVGAGRWICLTSERT